MLCSSAPFDNERHVLSNDLHTEIYSQLFYLQIHCVKFFFDTINENSNNKDEFINVLKSFIETSQEIYNELGVDGSYVFQCCGQVLRLLENKVTETERSTYSKAIIAGLLCLRLLCYVPPGSKIVPDILSGIVSGGLGNLKIDLLDLREAFINQPYTTNTLINIVNPSLPLTKSLFSLSLNQILDTYNESPESSWKLLQLIGHCSLFTEYNMDSVKYLLSFTGDKKCLRKHIVTAIGLCQSNEQLYQFSLSFRDQIIEDIVRVYGPVPDKVIDTYERLCYCLVVHGLPTVADDPDSWSHIGWLVLITNGRGIISLLLNIIRTLLDSRSLDALSRLLRSPNMTYFNQLLLINLWHPNLADEATMQTLLDLCYVAMTPESQTNYVEQLCLKIRTRWDTLKRFNERLSSIRKEQDTPTQLILALTTTGNTSHLELVTGLLDPTGFDCKVALDLLDRSGTSTSTSLLETASGNMSLETETIEENCDKNIFHCCVSIRKLWECLVLFSSIETRQLLYKYLHQHNTMTDTDIIDPELSFYSRLQFALQQNEVDLSNQLYQKNIVTRIEYLTCHIEQIYPLSLRLELLENLFSMLFLSEHDLFNSLATLNSRQCWPLPETRSVTESFVVVDDRTEEIMLSLDKNRFVASFFLLKDVVMIIDKNARILRSVITEMADSPLHAFDIKMAKTINYPLYNDIDTRISDLVELINDLQWRIGLLTSNWQGVNDNAIGIFDIPVCIMKETGVQPFAEAYHSKSNMRNRSKSSVTNRKLHPRPNKERLSSFGEEKENSHPEFSSKIIQLGLIPPPGPIIRMLSNHQIKDKFILFQSPSMVVDNHEQVGLLTTDDGEQNAIKSNEYLRLRKITKGNCQFLMSCVPYLMESVEQLTITILTCGFRDKAEEIYSRYGQLKSESVQFSELLSEIGYRNKFDSLTAQLSSIITPDTDTISEQSSSMEPVPFGQFNWKKLPALNVKLASKKEDDFSAVLNNLVTLDIRNRPHPRFDKKTEHSNKEFVNNEIKHFNCGLLFDIAISGSITQWQLSKTIGLLEQYYGKCDYHYPVGDVGNQVVTDLSKYHKMPGLMTVVTQIVKATERDTPVDCDGYVALEMGSRMESDYVTFMDDWLGELQCTIQSLQLVDSSTVDVSSTDGTKSSWKCLSNLIIFIKNTCTDVNKKDMPFRSLDRSIPLYLDSLYSHLEIFANFLDKYKNSPEKLKYTRRKSIVQLQNEFSVLRLSPLQALGELIFLKAEDPMSREMLQISDDLGLIISAVVLENCIPTIMSCGSTLSSNVDECTVSFADRRDVYNLSNELAHECVYNLNPVDIINGCLNRIIQILLKHTYTTKQTDTGMEKKNPISPIPYSVTQTNAASIFSMSSVTSTDTSSSGSSNKAHDSNVKSSTKSLHGDLSNIVFNSGWRVFSILSHDEDWRDVLESDIVDLEHVNLDLLRTNNEKTAFFINLYNFMMIHLAVLMIESGKTSMKYRSLESKLMRSNFCYKVGQIGVVSIEQISQYYLNIPDVTFSDLTFGLSEITTSLPTVTEQLYRSNCKICHNMAIFGMIDGTVSGQPLKVYTPDNVHKDLQNNLSYTIKYKTTCESEKRQIFLPQIFKWYAKLVCTDHAEQRHKSVSDYSTINSNTDEIIIQKILSKCNPKVARKFSLLLRLDTDQMTFNTKEQTLNKVLKIIWQSRSESIGCSFIEKRKDTVSNIPKLTELASSAKSNLGNYPSVIGKPYFPVPNYQPTIEAINHLRNYSPLLACLAYLAIGDDFVSIPSSVVDTGASDSVPITKTRSLSSVEMDEKIGEIRSYKYSRIVNEFPAIGNWIMTFWSEWPISRKSGQSLHINVSPVIDSLVTYCCSNIPIEIRWAAFTHPLTSNLDQILIEYSLNVMSRDQYGYLNIASALRMLHSQTMSDSTKLQHLLDIILEKCARYWAKGLIINTNNTRHLPPDITAIDNESIRLQEERLLDCIYAMQDSELRLSESTRYLDLFNINNALTLMEFNYSGLSNKANEAFEKQISMLRIFKRIHDLVIDCQTKYKIWWRGHIPTEFLDWHRLQTLSENDPNLVLKFLIKEKQFDLAKCWCRLYMPEDGEEKIEAEYLVSLVTGESDKNKIIEVISHITQLHRECKATNFMRVVHHVIKHSEAPLAIILICSYAIKNNIFNEFESVDGVPMADWRVTVHRSWVGASMLRSISNDLIRDQYSQLVQHPHLIMEQLIMNAEIDVFHKMMDLYKEQKKAYIAIKMPQTGNRLNRMLSNETFTREEFISELEPERINALLTYYIRKALELSAIRGDDDMDVETESLAPRVMGSRSSFASFRPDITASTESNDTVVNTSDSRPSDNLDTMSTTDTFAIPTVPPPPHKWHKDSDAPKCMCCMKEKFSMFNRRHHCRRCGRVICSQCSTNRMSIDGVTVRICDDCHRTVNDQHDSDDRARRGNTLFDNHHVSSIDDLLYLRHNLPTRSKSVTSLPSVAVFEQTGNSPVSVAAALQLGVGSLENGWRLGTDDAANDIIRQMFYYDDAPSVTIAFSLADLHSNSNNCGNVLLDTVEYLADFLKPMKNHLPNPEVDYLLVLDIAKQIAYKAKLKFSRLNNDMDFDRAENYLSRLDLLSVLVRSSFCNYLPSLSDGSKFIERIQSLRDKLIREERLELAGIVSSKAGLSNDPVFVAMGLHALDEGKYDEARKLFASCSKIGRYGSQSSSVLTYPVNEIMKILEGSKLSVVAIKEIVNNIIDTDDLLKTPDLKYREDAEMSRKQIEEAIYYLDIYNAPMYCLQFLCRQQMWSKAIDYIFKKNVTREVFIDGLIAPAVNSGHFALVKSEILMKEGGLSSWKFYYESLCKLLDKKGCYDDLLEFQEKAGDHLQVTRTLTNYFYLRGAQSYLMLKDRIGYLEKAKRHLEIYINKKESNPSFDLQKLMKNLNLVKQQIDATLFLTDPTTISHHQAKLGYIVKSTSPPTLFGTPEAIVDMCLMILFCRPNIADGLQMLCPLMAQCHIYAEKILPKAAVWLLQNPPPNQQTGIDPEIAGVTAVFELCTNICSCYRLDSRKNDEVLLSILPVIPTSLLVKSNLVNRFISLLKSETKKIDAYIVVKDLRRAFTNAVRLGYANEVQRILELAEESNDLSGVIDLCRQWLSQNKASIPVAQSLKNSDKS